MAAREEIVTVNLDQVRSKSTSTVRCSLASSMKTQDMSSFTRKMVKFWDGFFAPASVHSRQECTDQPVASGVRQSIASGGEAA